ncbi:LppA family lipoprotein [Mycolicibacterium sp. 050232]|nr:LppA family lipoprotein [Mycolicibacterium sp. 050232]MED5816101.1 LppA family lipoprotein [Mycolicibacterium sp. 050232]
MAIGGCSLTENPHEDKTLKGDEAVKLIDSMRAKGSYEAARQRLTDTAKTIAERIAAAVPGQTWKFNDDPNVQEAWKGGQRCEELAMNIARRPMADSVVFGRLFSTEEFATAHDIVREEAAQYGATDDSSLFNDPAKRDFDVQGNGYKFNIGQMKRATLNITGDCFLMQSVVDSPPGQLPSEPPRVPTDTRPTP